MRPMMTSEGSLRPSSAAFILPTPSSSEISCVFGCAKGLRQQRVLDGEAGGAGRLQLLHGAADIERVAIAVIGIDQHRQAAARDIRRICSASSVSVISVMSGSPSTASEATEPPNMPSSKPRSSAMRIEIAS